MDVMSWYLIHGAASTRLTWTHQLSLLPSVRRAELPDLPDVASQDLIAAWADWCLQDMAGPAFVMGHSLGGAIAQTMALQAPHLVRGLVLVGTGPRLPVSPALLDGLERDPLQTLKNIARWSLAKSASDTLLQRSIAQAASYSPRRALAEFKACQTFDVRDQLHTIRCPRALIGADQDRMTPLALMEEFHIAWPEVPLSIIHDAGHMMMLEQPQPFNAVLGDLIRRWTR